MLSYISMVFPKTELFINLKKNIFQDIIFLLVFSIQYSHQYTLLAMLLDYTGLLYELSLILVHDLMLVLMILYEQHSYFYYTN